MQFNQKVSHLSSLVFSMLLVFSAVAMERGKKWSTDQAWKWYNETPWICGFNYIPSNAINYTAMWDKTSYSPEVIESVLPVFASENVGCLHWGLVNGKTQTNLPWGHRPGNGSYTRIWQHDLYTTDYKMYSPYELELFKTTISKSKSPQSGK